MGITGTKVYPPKRCGDCSVAQTYVPRIFEPVQDPCKDACGAWKKFRVKVTKECPVCITLINVVDTGIEGFTIHTKKGCDNYKPMQDFEFSEEECTLVLIKPGAYEFRPKSGAAFPKDFEWYVADISNEALANMLSVGGKHAVL